MPAFLASRRTASQPVRTTGLKAMTLTRCWTNERIAEIWFSCSPLASENFRSTSAALAASWMDVVLAVRHPLSAPTWEKPMVSWPPRRDAAAARRLSATARRQHTYRRDGHHRS